MTDGRGPKIGIVTKLGTDPEAAVEDVRASGSETCHLSVYDPGYLTGSSQATLQHAMERFGVRVDAVWAGWPGHVVWDFMEGPTTTGLVPLALRQERAATTKRVADFARTIGATMLMTHLGFVPEDHTDERYISLIPVIREIAAYCGERGLSFCVETGPMTPITLLRTIEDVGLDNVGVNFDPANLLMYGKANPVDALDVLAPLIRGIHIKDGRYPTNTRDLGVETRVGEGQVDFPRLLRTLRDRGYSGNYYIETEVYDAKRQHLLADARQKLERWLAQCESQSPSAATELSRPV